MHRAATRCRKTVTINIDDVDIAGALRDPLFNDSHAFVGERVRKAVESHVFDEPTFKKNVTISLGVGELCPGVESIEDLIKAADKAVYEAKGSGRNKVCIAPPLTTNIKKPA